MKQIGIIGGGAGGLMAAISAAQELRRMNAHTAVEVVIYEADPERVGRSILATGNGRCNWSNARISSAEYRNSEFVECAFNQVTPQAVREQFSCLGLSWREEAQGRLYPYANKASSVLSVLRAALARYGVRVEYGKQAVAIEQQNGRYHLRFADKAIKHADALVLACGGRAVSAIEFSSSLKLQSTAPVLGPLEVNDAGKKLTRQLNNIRVRCVASLKRDGEIVASEQGELLFRDYGVSGVCVFNLSRLAKPGDFIVINFVPDFAAGNKHWLLQKSRNLVAAFASENMTYDDVLRGILLPQVAKVVLGELGFKPEDVCTDDGIGKVSCMLEKFKLQVTGIGDARQCQVWRGGLDVACFNAETCESRDLPGFYAAGEALDVDAPCGGYNLHWAWASGMLAGDNAAKCVVGEGK